MGVIDQLEGKIIAIKQLVCERDALAAQNERLRSAMEEVREKADDWHSSVEWEGREYTGAVIEVIDRALSVAPLAALEELRRRERSIGAEEELRRLATVADGNWAADELSDRADQIRVAREKVKKGQEGGR